jgi:hypothetical protein
MDYVDDGETVKAFIVNHEDMKVEKTQEVEPEHFICHTFTLVLPENIAGSSAFETQQHILDILELDPMRKDAAIQSLDNPIVICHSKAQAQSSRNQDAGLPEPDGIPLAAGQTLAVTGTGALWAVANVTGNSRVSVITNRRGN